MKIRIDRLLELINAPINQQNPKSSELVCGDLLGDAPLVWPQNWTYTTIGVALISESLIDFRQSAEEWFEISQEQVNWLFIPNSVTPWGIVLGNDYTREQACANALQFIEWSKTEHPKPDPKPVVPPTVVETPTETVGYNAFW